MINRRAYDILYVQMKKIIIFTDLDGTLLDHSGYSFEAALPALGLVKERDIPLVICSSKTRREIEHYRNKLHNTHPFISENGGGIFIPEDYFQLRIQYPGNILEAEAGFMTIRLGAKYSDLRKALQELRADGFAVKGFGDMTPEEVSAATGLSRDEAEMAKDRDFDEPFVVTGPVDEKHLIAAIKDKGFNCTQGQFYHILGNSDKGRAVSILTDLYRKQSGDTVTIAIGDSPNDIPMLEMADHPVIVRKYDGEYDSRINVRGMVKADGIGPTGWNRTVTELLSRLV